MTDEPCECCGTVETGIENDTETESESAGAGGRWLGDDAVATATLPDDVRTAMSELFGDASVTTLEEWVDALRERTGGGPLEIDDLCHADGRTAHWGELEGTRYYFRCFYDAVALAELTDDPVEIRTASPDGTVVEARATGDGEVTATPSTAVVSFGVDPDGSSSSPPDEPTLEDAYAAICPAVRAFPTRNAYEQWAARTSAATVGVPLSAATTVATGLV